VYQSKLSIKTHVHLFFLFIESNANSFMNRSLFKKTNINYD